MALGLAAATAGCGSEAPATELASPSQAEATATCAPSECGASPATAAASSSASASPVALPAPDPIPEGMVRIPEGIFLMGSPRERGSPEERPMHERVIAAFYMDVTEVTVAAYAKCVDAKVCRSPRESDRFCNVKGDHLDHPVNCVDHVDATTFCSWVGKRLPSEAEWEYAASGGGENRRYSWGEEDPDPGRACYAHPGGTCPVGSFAPGAYGLHDMCGNVWEWTSSYFGMFPEEPAKSQWFVFKGGSWSRRWPKWLRVRNRSRWEPEKENSWLGFRCAKGIAPPVCPIDTGPADPPAKPGQICVRTRGQPTCEPGLGWNGHACTSIGSDGKPTAGSGEVVASYGDPGMAGAPDEPVTVQRTPGDDADCVKNYREKVAAYRWTGSTWEARVKLVAAQGCTRRDNGARWVSACCRQ